jgi:hypothetical protein
MPPVSQRGFFAGVVNAWLVESGVTPQLRWEGERRIAGFSSVGVLDAVAAQLFVVVGAHASCRCAGCHKFFKPDRQPPTGVRTWCSNCVEDGERARQVSRDSYARLRETLLLHAEGQPIREIAKRTGSTVAVVKRRITKAKARR